MDLTNTYITSLLSILGDLFILRQDQSLLIIDDINDCLSEKYNQMPIHELLAKIKNYAFDQMAYFQLVDKLIKATNLVLLHFQTIEDLEDQINATIPYTK